MAAADTASKRTAQHSSKKAGDRIGQAEKSPAKPSTPFGMDGGHHFTGDSQLRRKWLLLQYRSEEKEKMLFGWVRQN